MIMDWLPTDLLWRNALAVIPLAIVVALLCRFVPCRPSTRHTLWLVVLIVLVVAPFLPSVPLPAVTAVTGSGQAQEPQGPAPLELAPALPAADTTSEPLGTTHRIQRPAPVDQIVRGAATRPSPPPAPRRSSPRHGMPAPAETAASAVSSDIGVAWANSFAHADVTKDAQDMGKRSLPMPPSGSSAGVARANSSSPADVAKGAQDMGKQSLPMPPSGSSDAGV
ncbi:MAG: hypothetical protein ACYS0D_06065, partial [Planctomycetota bacterium]